MDKTASHSKVGGFGYTPEVIQVLFVPARKPVPFNIDTIEAINKIWVPTRGDDGREHLVDLRVQDQRSGPIVPRIQEEQGLRRETLVWVSVPKTSVREAFKALQDVGRDFGFKVERATSSTKPGVRKLAMTKIASPTELRSELQRLLAYAGSEKPSREKLASELRGLADRIAVSKS